MCMRVFSLQRCLPQSRGGCDAYWAHYEHLKECGGYSLNGLPQLNCRAVWGGFESETSSKVNREEFYARRPMLCPACTHRADINYLRDEAIREQRGEYSEAMQKHVRDLEYQANCARGAMLGRAHTTMWDGVHTVIAGLGVKTDVVWSAIEQAIYRHLGPEAMGHAGVQEFAKCLMEAKKEVVDHVRGTTRELAIALVGGQDETDYDAVHERHLKEDAEKRAERERRVVEVAESAAREREMREEEREMREEDARGRQQRSTSR
ncbi:hypothetical protein CKAH01_14668 [Colletotrichum kahawae]|uniref:Uncharacterized protein n=1 Tax=Colletotrichum kahawae TaxID=34407 RepID=A0AAE0D9W7_COLKA|nr:hypothetical protein CKAH01_14668 [Colletotrichum kahawae]